MSVLLVLVGMVVFILGVVALFKPMPKLRLNSKGAAAVAMVLGVGSCVGGGAMMPPAPEGTESAAPAEDADVPAATRQATAEPAGLAIGSPVQVRDAEIVITEVTTRDQVGIEYAYEQPSQGGVLVVVKFTVRNAGERPLSYFQPRIRLVDPSGVEYSADLGKTAALQMEGGTDGKLLSDLNPGITTREAMVFEVAADRYNPATWRVSVDGRRNLVVIQ